MPVPRLSLDVAQPPTPPTPPTPPASPTRLPLRLRLVALTLALGALSLLTGCNSEFFGPMPGSLSLSRDQPGGSVRAGHVEATEYQVHLFWGIWSPHKTNSWETLTKAVSGHGADGAYDVEVETFMPWWHVLMYAWTVGIVDITGHTVKAETYKLYKVPAASPPPNIPAPASGPAGVQTSPSPPPPKPIITAPADQPTPAAPAPGRAAVTDPHAPKPVVAPPGPGAP